MRVPNCQSLARHIWHTFLPPAVCHRKGEKLNYAASEAWAWASQIIGAIPNDSQQSEGEPIFILCRSSSIEYTTISMQSRWSMRLGWWGRRKGEQREELTGGGGPRHHVASTLAKSPTKTTISSNMNGFNSWMAEDFWFHNSMVETKLWR
jgi:hypothetical protein